MKNWHKSVQDKVHIVCSIKLNHPLQNDETRHPLFPFFSFVPLHVLKLNSQLGQVHVWSNSKRLEISLLTNRLCTSHNMHIPTISLISQQSISLSYMNVLINVYLIMIAKTNMIGEETLLRAMDPLWKYFLYMTINFLGLNNDASSSIKLENWCIR